MKRELTTQKRSARSEKNVGNLLASASRALRRCSPCEDAMKRELTTEKRSPRSEKNVGNLLASASRSDFKAGNLLASAAPCVVGHDDLALSRRRTKKFSLRALRFSVVISSLAATSSLAARARCVVARRVRTR